MASTPAIGPNRQYIYNYGLDGNVLGTRSATEQKLSAAGLS
jgi:hypothetical protein